MYKEGILTWVIFFSFNHPTHIIDFKHAYNSVIISAQSADSHERLKDTYKSGNIGTTFKVIQANTTICLF